MIGVLALSAMTQLTLHSACLTSILRTESSFRIVGKHDQTYELIPLAFWSSALSISGSIMMLADFLSRDAEMASGIICGCMPVMPQFFRHFLPKIKSHFTSYNRSRAESASRGIQSAADPTVPSWNNYNDSHKLKGKDFDIDLHSLDQTSNVPRDGIKTHARELSNESITQGSPVRDLESCLN